MGAGDLSGKGVIRTELDAALAKKSIGAVVRRARRKAVVVDTTASMTVNQVVEFWKVASAELLTLIAERAHLQPGLSGLARETDEGQLLDVIAERALRKVFTR
jgi:hypothetical protein